MCISNVHLRTRLFLLVLVAAMAWPSAGHAQTGAASITGIVTDESGASLPGVTVTATNEATNVPYTAVSNESGNYTMTSVPVGVYVVQAELTGFKLSVTAPITLEANQTARMDFTLEVGALQETVEVVGANPVLQTESTSVGEVISARTATALPLNGRNTGQLSLLLTGTVTPNPAAFTEVRNFGSGRPFVNGNREQTNNYTLDGVDMNESIDNLVPYQPNPDALAEIGVETNNYAAELGNVAGAVLANVIKSGSNEIRGNVFEFYRNSDFDANSWQNNRSDADKPERTQHIFGGTIGGPIVRDRLFFFGDYQGTRLDEPSSSIQDLAPESWRRGDLSNVSTPVVDPLTGQPFPGNRIPESRISPVARAILDDTALYPLPNREIDVGQGNYVGESLTTTRAHQWDVKIDASLSNADKVWGRFSYADYEELPERRATPLFMENLIEAPTRNFGFNWNRIFSATLVNELLVGYNQVGQQRFAHDWAGLGNGNQAFGIPGDQPIPGLSSIRPGSGLDNFGAAAANWDTQNKTYQINEKLTWLIGRHAFKLGGQWLYLRQQRYYAGNNGAQGLFEYDGSFTGFAFGDFLLDQLSRKGRGSVEPPWTHLHHRVAIFAQDNFKIRPNLTLNLGLRWANTSPLVEKDDRQANFDLETGEHLLAGVDGNSRALYEPYYGGWEPRLGFAWTATDRWVVRGAYGITQYMEGTGANLRLPLNPPFFFESDVQYDATSGPGEIATGFEGLEPQDQPAGQVRAFDPNLRPQFTQQWNIFGEYLLARNTSLNVGYVGHKADHLVTPVEGNQPLAGDGDPSTWAPLQERRPLFEFAPEITNISTTAARGRSNYHALQGSARQRLTNGLEFLVSYTWSKTMTNNLGYYGGGAVVAASGAYWYNAYDPEKDYAPAFFDATHNFVYSANYELPFGRDRARGNDWSALTDAILGGWVVSGILQIRSGFPITVNDGSGESLQAVRGGERPNRVGSGEVDDPTIDRWVDIGAFERAPQGTFGDSGVGILRAPGYWNVDFVLAKRFPIMAERYGEVKVEGFNLFNHPSFGPPARDISDPDNFGTITSTVGSSRTVELVFKFYF
ncbi:MAG: hypothetical protein GEU99_19775 [Luteitalea sp.]|nr:hypothetical protein [Luteitalea sp.]